MLTRERIAQGLSVLGVAIVAMFQVGPSDAETNFCRWIRLLIDVSPTCLSEVPLWAMWATPIILIATGIVWGWWPVFQTRWRLEPSALIIIGVIVIILGVAGVVGGEIWRRRQHSEPNIETHALGLLHYRLPSQLAVLDFNGLQHHDPYFEIHLAVWNTAPFAIYITGVTGFLRVGHQDCNTPARLTREDTIPGVLGKAANPEQRNFVIRQVVTAGMAASISAALPARTPVHIDLPRLTWTGTVHLSSGSKPIPEIPIAVVQVEVEGPLPRNGQIQYGGIVRVKG